MISNCRSSMGNDVNGDASSQEYRLQSWFSMDWDTILRHPDENVQKYISNFARHAAQNDHIGYSQNQRLGFWNQLKGLTTYDPKDIITDCAADCSSSTMAIVKAVGYALNNTQLKNVNESCTTWTMADNLVNAGFQRLQGTQYTASESNLKPGDIILNTNSHVCIEVADSDFTLSGVSKSKSSTGSGTTAQTSYTGIPITANTKSAGVAAIQGALIYLGKEIGRYKDNRGAMSGVDGDAGSATSKTNTLCREAINEGLLTKKQIDAILEVFK